MLYILCTFKIKHTLKLYHFIYFFATTWEQHKLGDIAEFYNGDRSSRYPNDSDIVSDGIPFINAGDLVSGHVKLDTANKITEKKYNELSGAKIQLGDIIYCLRGTLGKNAFVDNFDIGTVASSLVDIRPKEIVGKFLFQVLNSDIEFRQRILNDEGAAQPNLSAKNLSMFEIPNPSRAEQIKVAEYFENLDNIISLHQRKLEKLGNIKKSMLEKMFPKDENKVPEIRFKGFNDDWEQHKFEEIFNERREKTSFENEDILLSCAINGIFLNSELFDHFRGSSTIGYLKVKKNDLILSAQNLHLGNANVNLRFEHGIISPAYKVYDYIDCNPNFIQSWVKKDETKNFFLSATTEGASQCRKNIEWNTLNKQKLLIPKFKEQKKIGEFFKQLDNDITLHQRKPIFGNGGN